MDYKLLKMHLIFFLYCNISFQKCYLLEILVWLHAWQGPGWVLFRFVFLNYRTPGMMFTRNVRNHTSKCILEPLLPSKNSVLTRQCPTQVHLEYIKPGISGRHIKIKEPSTDQFILLVKEKKSKYEPTIEFHIYCLSTGLLQDVNGTGSKQNKTPSNPKTH